MEKIDIRQKALQDMLGQRVNKIQLGLYSWAGIIYEVLPPNKVKARHNWSGFVKHTFGKRTFYIREASEFVINKYYAKT